VVQIISKKQISFAKKVSFVVLFAIKCIDCLGSWVVYHHKVSLDQTQYYVIGHWLDSNNNKEVVHLPNKKNKWKKLAKTVEWSA
jgi:hypothetical protein